MTLAFKKATRAQAKLRMVIMGTAKAGKTATSLRVASALGQKIAFIDTERGSASKYAGDWCDFDVLELDDFSPNAYVEAIHVAESAGYDVIVVDSLSHAWFGKGGALEIVDDKAARSASKNTFMAWRDVTPMHNRLVDAIVGCKAHVICTLRTKTEYIIESTTRNGRTVQEPRKIGMAPIQREGMDYEFDVVCEINQEHVMVVQGTRCPAVDGMRVEKPGPEFGEILKEWLSDGPASTPPQGQTPPAAQPSAAAASQTQPKEAAPPEEPKRRQPDYSKIPKSFEYGGGRWSGTPIAEAPADVLHMLIDDREARMSSLDPNKSDASFVRYACQEAIKHARKALLEVFEETHPAQMKSA